MCVLEQATRRTSLRICLDEKGEDMKHIASIIKNNRFTVLLVVWGMIDLLCAILCDIHADEAYHRLYGQYLDWGYFDHPPMVALMTFISDVLVPGTSIVAKNLSVRLMTVLLHMATVFLVWKTLNINDRTDKRTQNVFFLIAGSMVMFNAYGFITAPDAPLLFFGALFYYAYRQYLCEASWKYAFLLSVSIAGMFYSKYMAVLAVGFIVLSNWRLICDKRLWAAIGLAAVMLIPHLYWQYANNFPSFTYHLVDRSMHYNWLYTLDYLPNQLVVFNPLAYGLMIWLAVRGLKSEDMWQRGMSWSILGFQLFFLTMTVRGHVEPHWTMLTSIPAIVMLVEDWLSNPTNTHSLFAKRWVRTTMVAMFGLVLVARVVLMLNVLPARTGLANLRPYYAAIHEAAEGLPVVFDGSFQRPSLYRFYYDDNAVLVRQEYDRYTQYDLLQLEKELLGKKVCLIRAHEDNEQITVGNHVISRRMVEELSMEDLQ